VSIVKSICLFIIKRLCCKIPIFNIRRLKCQEYVTFAERNPGQDTA
jgi:hypothetical protein